MKKNPEMINDALLAYRAAPLTNNEYSPAELMFKRIVKAHMISLHVHFPTDDRSPENINRIEQKESIHNYILVIGCLYFIQRRKLWNVVF